MIDNCVKCNILSDQFCEECKNGFYLYRGKCISKCPNGFRADRLTWTCIKNEFFAYYWIYPSRNSCKENCGKVRSLEMDCSCEIDCFQSGTCCQDMDEYCKSVLETDALISKEWRKI